MYFFHNFPPWSPDKFASDSVWVLCCNVFVCANCESVWFFLDKSLVAKIRQVRLPKNRHLSVSESSNVCESVCFCETVFCKCFFECFKTCFFFQYLLNSSSSCLLARRPDRGRQTWRFLYIFLIFRYGPRNEKGKTNQNGTTEICPGFRSGRAVPASFDRILFERENS